MEAWQTGRERVKAGPLSWAMTRAGFCQAQPEFPDHQSGNSGCVSAGTHNWEPEQKKLAASGTSRSPTRTPNTGFQPEKSTRGQIQEQAQEQTGCWSGWVTQGLAQGPAWGPVGCQMHHWLVHLGVSLGS